jgi:hypothetical protein
MAAKVTLRSIFAQSNILYASYNLRTRSGRGLEAKQGRGAFTGSGRKSRQLDIERLDLCSHHILCVARRTVPFMRSNNFRDVTSLLAGNYFVIMSTGTPRLYSLDTDAVEQRPSALTLSISEKAP